MATIKNCVKTIAKNKGFPTQLETVGDPLVKAEAVQENCDFGHRNYQVIPGIMNKVYLNSSQESLAHDVLPALVERTLGIAHV